MKLNLTALIILIIHLSCFSQDTVQLVKGRITDRNSNSPVQSTSVHFEGSHNYIFLSDSNGYYSGIVLPGTYVIHIHKTGYKDQIRDNIIVFSGKQNVQDFEVTSFRIELDSVQVTADNNNEHVELDLWNIQRFAAVFYDPARAANFHAGLVNTDDQANNISVHGTSPNFIQWKIEGVEVVNPNHLENAGTLNDRPALNGGGVSLFSAQLLQNSSFMFSPLPSSYGNALTGSFDMRLRNGNSDDYEHTVQASLMGLDFSMEGPFTKRHRSSFLFNYRYSTVGLLSKMGVSFGGEKINYQDLSFVLSFPHKNGILKLFSIIGESENIFRGKTDSTELEFQKDLMDIDYRSLSTISGLNYIHSLSNSLYLRTIASYSNKTIKRNSQPTGLTYRNFIAELDRFEQQKFSGCTYLSKRIGRDLSLKAGSYYNYFIYGQEYRIDDVAISKGSITEPLLQPFVSFEGAFKRLELHAGVHSLYQLRISDFTLLPKASIKYIASNSHDIMLKYGREAQLQPFLLYLGTLQNRSLKPTVSDGISLIHHFNVLRTDIKTELYYTLFDEVPVNTQNGFSAFNYFNEQVLFTLEQSGKAQTYGIDLTVEKNIRLFYMIFSAGIFNSTYSMNSNYYKSRYNCNYNIALTMGKEYALKDKRKMLSTDLRGFVRDGFRETSGNITNEDIYNTSLPSYYRVDLRFSYRKNKLKSSVIWALDIQNLTNTKNVSYHYFDLYTGKVEAKEQLGLIPVISYKVFF